MQNINVDFIIGGFPCQGILHKEDNTFYLEVTSSIPTISYKPRTISCHYEKKLFVLHNNTILSKRIYPDFVVENYEYSFFKSFTINLDGLQDFLSEAEYHNGLVFSEKIKINNESYNCECYNDSKKTLIKIRALNHFVELEKINSIVLRFVQLFTLLSYKRIACTSIQIIDEEKEHEFFTWRNKTFEGQRGRHYSLLHAGLIYKNYCWKNILVNYFDTKRDFFENCLNDYIALIDTNSFWQHKIISICGIWDRYITLTKVKVDCRYTFQDFDYIFNFLQKNIKRDYSLFNETQKGAINILFEKKKDLIKNLLRSPLYERFCVFYNQIDEKIHFIFPQTLTDFNLLKLSRNKYAHGYSNYRPTEDFEEIYQSFRRIRLMTIVFIYEELGISLIDICKGLRINVDEKTWNYFKQPKVYSCFNYNKSTGFLELDEKVSEDAWNENLHGHNEPFYGNYVTKVYPKCENPVYLNNIFLIYKGSHREVCGSFLLNYEDVPDDLKKKCEIQRTDLLLRRLKKK